LFISFILAGGRRVSRVKLSIDATGKDKARLITKAERVTFTGLARRRLYMSTSSLPRIRSKQRHACNYYRESGCSQAIHHQVLEIQEKKKKLINEVMRGDEGILRACG
jgi:hypothetical protein